MEAIRRTLFLVPIDASPELRAAMDALWASLREGRADMLAREDALRDELVRLGVPSHPLTASTFRGWIELRAQDEKVRASLDDALTVARDELLEIARRSAADADSNAVVDWLGALPRDASVCWLGASAHG